VAVREIEVDDESKHDATDVVVFLPTDTRKGGYTIGEQVDIMIWRKTSTTSIELVGSIRSFDPKQQIFEDALIKLMEGIGRHRAVDVDKGEIMPIWMRHWFYAQLLAALDKESQVEIIRVGECR